MMSKARLARWIFPFLFFLSYILSACVPSEQSDVLTDIPSAERAEQNDAFIRHAEANNWYIASGGSFVKLDEHLDAYWLPKNGYERSTTLDLLYAKYLGRLYFSPDGKLLVATAHPHGVPRSSKSPHFIIFDMDLNAMVERHDLLNHFPHSAYRWSPDGKFISFAWESAVMLYDVSADSFTEIYNDFKIIEQGMVSAGTPNWSADSKQLVFQTNSNEMAILTITTGEVDIIGEGRRPTWSPDGRAIVFHQGRWDHLVVNSPIMEYDVTTGEVKELFELDFTLTTQPIWTPDSQYLAFKRGFVNSIYGELMVYSYADNEVQATGKAVATLVDAFFVELLPAQLESRLRLRNNYEEENPNRNPKRYGDSY